MAYILDKKPFSIKTSVYWRSYRNTHCYTANPDLPRHNAAVSRGLVLLKSMQQPLHDAKELVRWIQLLTSDAGPAKLSGRLARELFKHAGQVLTVTEARHFCNYINWSVAL